MLQKDELPNRPGRAAPARPVEWSLGALYAALLIAAIWKLDADGLPDATREPTATRDQASMPGFTESLRRPFDASTPLSRLQTAPEGWPLWAAGPDDRAAPDDAPPAPGRSAETVVRDAAGSER